MNKQFSSGLMWFRRDLRVADNAALHAALAACKQVHCVFVFDREILDALPKRDRRVEFIRESLVALDLKLRELSGLAAGGLIVCHAAASQAIAILAKQLDVQAVFANHDYEPQALARDAKVLGALAHIGVAWRTAKDQVIFEKNEVLTLAERPFSVFTPYKNAWLKKLSPAYLEPHPVEQCAAALAARPEGLRQGVPTLADLGFEASNLAQLKISTGEAGAQALLDDFLPRMGSYQETRNFPAVKGPSYLSVHLRFGTVSIRQLAALAQEQMQQPSPGVGAGASTWLSELIWRDFYFQILSHHPHVASRAFKPEYDAIAWEGGKHGKDLFAAWCAGATGYPLVDAAMAQINQTGYMHNRLRMVVASFLIKDLGIDWRWGERYFAEHLNDFDLAANNGGWQWAASSGCDAQPYFRIFNPVAQSEKFDAAGKFIRRYLPQLAGLPDVALHSPWTAKPVDLAAAGVVLGQNYPLPLVDHAAARAQTLQRYAVVKLKAPA